MTRYSRSGGKAISLVDDLRNKYGIHIIAVSEQVDTSHSTGVVMQNMQLIFAAWDNAQRKEITQMGMKSKYEKGEWLIQLPPGYEVVKVGKERKIVISAEGQKIKKAWLWKYNGMSNEEIFARLVKMGVNMYKQKATKILRTLFTVA
jgi:site-specific DNA recombinase